MGDSTPRGLAPNTLSNCVDRCSRETKGVYLCRSTPVADAYCAALDAGGQAGTATETATVRSGAMTLFARGGRETPGSGGLLLVQSLQDPGAYQG